MLFNFNLTLKFQIDKVLDGPGSFEAIGSHTQKDE